MKKQNLYRLKLREKDGVKHINEFLSTTEGLKAKLAEFGLMDGRYELFKHVSDIDVVTPKVETKLEINPLQRRVPKLIDDDVV